MDKIDLEFEVLSKIITILLNEGLSGAERSRIVQYLADRFLPKDRQ